MGELEIIESLQPDMWGGWGATSAITLISLELTDYGPQRADRRHLVTTSDHERQRATSGRDHTQGNTDRLPLTGSGRAPPAPRTEEHLPIQSAAWLCSGSGLDILPCAMTLRTSQGTDHFLPSVWETDMGLTLELHCFSCKIHSGV